MTYRTSLPLHPTEDDKPKKRDKLNKRIIKSLDKWKKSGGMDSSPDGTPSKKTQKISKKIDRLSLKRFNQY